MAWIIFLLDHTVVVLHFQWKLSTFMLHLEGIMPEILKDPVVAQLGIAICHYTLYFQISMAFLENL